jgi:hypothetical protein
MNGERWPLESQTHNADATMLHPMSLDGCRSGRPQDRVTILILILIHQRVRVDADLFPSSGRTATMDCE